MNYKAAFHTLGCRVNSYETQAIKEQFFALGFEEAAFDEAADVYVINTCSVTQIAERKSRQMINRARKLSPGAVIAATGCYATEDAQKLINDGMADIVAGNNEKSRLAMLAADMLRENGKFTPESEENDENPAAAQKNTPEEVCFCDEINPENAEKSDPGQEKSAYPYTEKAPEKKEGLLTDPDTPKPAAKGKNVLTRDLLKCTEYEEQKITTAGGHVRAYIKIQDGCNRFCSYCIIPYLRGRSRSRGAENIIAEAGALALNGYKEIIITGIDISDFEAEGYKKGDESLLYIIEEISKIKGIERIRTGSLECGIVTEAFMEGISGISQFCPHFHLSLQSGSESVLKRMNRKYTPDEYYEKVKLIRRYYPEAAISTDIIAGFPGETEEEFEETCAFVRKTAFSRVHVFKYSKRKGTKAADMPGQTDGNIKAQRSEILIGITDKLQREYEEKFIGRSVSVLFEELTGDGFYTGFTPEYVKVAAKSETDLVNKIVPVVPEGFAQTKAGVLLKASLATPQSGMA